MIGVWAPMTYMFVDLNQSAMAFTSAGLWQAPSLQPEWPDSSRLQQPPHPRSSSRRSRSSSRRRSPRRRRRLSRLLASVRQGCGWSAAPRCVRARSHATRSAAPRCQAMAARMCLALRLARASGGFASGRGARAAHANIKIPGIGVSFAITQRPTKSSRAKFASGPGSSEGTPELPAKARPGMLALTRWGAISKLEARGRHASWRRGTVSPFSMPYQCPPEFSSEKMPSEGSSKT
ncbi:unnamed protein product [Prorocentrum cordatum]|uniref:Uncharacterized protein n=1 Tax=Prorocentrum cordatum TaxID=2364126 RepID=A0ABN9V3H1_9DINO|nr:unnamed protein product [Polarella glacialis]